MKTSDDGQSVEDSRRAARMRCNAMEDERAHQIMLMRAEKVLLVACATELRAQLRTLRAQLLDLRPQAGDLSSHHFDGVVGL